MSIVRKNIDDITRTKTTLDNTERVPGRDDTGDFKITIANFAAAIKESIVEYSVKYAQASYIILDDDGYDRIEVDTSAGEIEITLPLLANNVGRRIEIAFVKKDASNDVVKISPNATDANKIGAGGLNVFYLYKLGDVISLQQSSNSGYWEIGNIELQLMPAGSAPVYACRAWVNFDGTTNTGGFTTIRGSGNVSSVADNGTGDYTVNFTTAIADANYCPTFGGCWNGGSPYIGVWIIVTQSAGSLRIKMLIGNGGTADEDYTSVAIFR
jgi:hypothetical protein